MSPIIEQVFHLFYHQVVTGKVTKRGFFGNFVENTPLTESPGELRKNKGVNEVNPDINMQNDGKMGKESLMRLSTGKSLLKFSPIFLMLGGITMATITNAQLSIEHDHNKKLAHVNVSGSVRFSELEMCQMRSCREANVFKLKCQLWGADWPDPDDHLYTIGTVYYFPDGDPTTSETRTFQVTLGEGVLDEDGWTRPKDEVYARLVLYNLMTGGTISRNSNTVEHYF